MGLLAMNTTLGTGDVPLTDGFRAWRQWVAANPDLDCAKLLAPKDASMILTVYAIRASALTFAQLLAETLKGKPGTYEVGELAILEQAASRAVPTSLFTRWIST